MQCKSDDVNWRTHKLITLHRPSEIQALRTVTDRQTKCVTKLICHHEVEQRSVRGSTKHCMSEKW